MVIDASGDPTSRPGAGADFALARKATRYASTMFRLGGVDTGRGELTRPQIRELLSAVADGYPLRAPDRGARESAEGVVHLNVTKLTNPTEPPCWSSGAAERAERVGRQQVKLTRKSSAATFGLRALA